MDREKVAVIFFFFVLSPVASCVVLLHVGPVLIHVFLVKVWMKVNRKLREERSAPQSIFFNICLHVMGTALSLVEGSLEHRL